MITPRTLPLEEQMARVHDVSVFTKSFSAEHSLEAVDLW